MENKPKLILNKETLRALTDKESVDVKGGISPDTTAGPSICQDGKYCTVHC